VSLLLFDRNYVRIFKYPMPATGHTNLNSFYLIVIFLSAEEQAAIHETPYYVVFSSLSPKTHASQITINDPALCKFLSLPYKLRD
jgi:hypothetical protein